MTKEELLSVLVLQKTPHIGDLLIKKLISNCGSAEAVLKEKKHKLLAIDGIGSYAITHLNSKIVLEKAEKELEYILENNISCHYYSDNAYPDKLKHCIDGPVLLFSRGAIKLAQQKIISIVGTRNITSHGAAFCEELIANLAPLNPVIISGFAYGVDICAQRAAVKNKLQTIGCLAHGLNQIYPKVHKKYMPAVEENGGFFTEFWSTDQPERENFLKRNRVIAGMSQATIVIESAVKGGSLVTADIANSYNREVFALPGRVTDNFSVGCNNLIKQQKAHLLTSAADIVYHLGWELEDKKPKTIQKQLFVEMNTSETRVFSFLQEEGKSDLDGIALHCQMPTRKVVGVLLNLELNGVVRPLPGKMFELI